jgi:hypothetical protein
MYNSYKESRLTATKVAGKKNIVNAAIVFIAVLSIFASAAMRADSCAMRLDSSAIWMLVLLSCWEMRL